MSPIVDFLLSDGALPALPPPKAPRILVERNGDEVVLSERRGPVVFQVGVGGFLLFWWLGWTVACAALVGRIVAEPGLETILFSVPFLDAWFFVLLALGAIFFGQIGVRLGPDGLVERWSILVLRGQRRVPLDEIQGITEYAQVVNSDSGRTEYGVKILTLGRSIRFALGTSAEERAWLIAFLEGRLRALQDISTPAGAPRPPSDSEIALQRGWDRLVFVRRSRSWGGILLGLTFLNLFWNGVLANFLLQLVKHFEWALCLFLVPFGIIGTVFLRLLADPHRLISRLKPFWP